MLELRLPIPHNFFLLPRLERPDIERYRAFGHKVAREFVDLTKLKHGPIDWTLRSTTSTTVVYEGRNSAEPIFLARTEIQATLDEVISVFQTTSVAATRKLQAEFQPLVRDKVRLHNITMPMPDNSHLYQSLNWCVVDTPFLRFILKRRDFCYMEHQEVIEIQGRRAFIRAMQSIAVAGVPSLESTFNVVRGDLVHYGFMFVETDQPGVLELQSLYLVRLNGKMNGALGRRLMKKAVQGHYRTLHNTEQVIRANYLSNLSFIDTYDLPLLGARQTKCEVCMKSFGRRRKTQCRHCAKIVCVRKCSAKWKLVKAGLNVRVRICALCSTRQPTRPAINVTLPTDSSKDFLLSMTSCADFSSSEDRALYTLELKPGRSNPLTKSAYF
ncbi:unnamed protein product [Aphanomyces euteiches]|uniref:FYVE-type domain-containing protein n=1 Tax=Aphanomyces euteiches TaxID=100861 RepID=A0A6G0X5T5_9STRA|nr:hypothetical protein Ae201684_008233 [Aphanomyces euteiches]KAH9070510.1 hypothetical protein Ae201684P_002867 [Aphanomyces euteiches]KAH9135305.1 hypothetical protein AeRB84_019236 [Aphanomyces euteiches]